MKKSIIITITLVLITMLLTSLPVNAEDIKTIGKDEKILKSQFLTGQEVNNDGIIQGDLFAGAETVASSGVIQGDLIAGGSSVLSSGTVTGDILCGASSIDISGIVGGNIRCAGSNVSIAGKVGKNINVFAEKIQIKSSSQIEGNLLAFGDYIRIEGTIKGYTKIYGNRITLSGEFLGDVDINLETLCDNHDQTGWNSGKIKPAIITIMPGTIIHGKLTYKSVNQADIRKGAVVKESQWIKRLPKKTNNIPSTVTLIWSFIKMLVATTVYFLIAMLLLKLFPGIFKHQSTIIHDKPIQAAGIGLIGMLSILAALIGLIILIIFSILFNAVSLSIVSGILLIAFFAGLFYLAPMPVSLWVGNLLCKEKYTLPIRFAVGLGTISLILFVLDILSKLPTIGMLFGFFYFVLVLGILLLGIGALIKLIGKVIQSIRKYNLGEIEP